METPRAQDLHSKSSSAYSPRARFSRSNLQQTLKPYAQISFMIAEMRSRSIISGIAMTTWIIAPILALPASTQSRKQSRTTAAAFYGSRASRGALLMLNPFVAQETQRAARLCPARPAAKAWGNWCREAAAAHRGLCVHTYVHANTCVYRRLSRAADGYLRRGSNGGARRRIARSEASRTALARHSAVSLCPSNSGC